MLLIEFVFHVLVFAQILRLLIEPLRSKLDTLHILIFGGVIQFVLIVFAGIRWQILPSFLVFGLLLSGSAIKTQFRLRWKVLAAIPLLGLLLLSTYLTSTFPLVQLPEPDGQYAVGTFDYSIVDTSRAERFEPSRNRELYVEAWYPVNKGDTEGHEDKALWQELYTGNFGIVSFFTNYLGHVETHSYVDAPISTDERFPILIFNHGLYLFTSQNTQLMEHLASHGYVVLSIAHPFESMKVNLDNSGKVLLTFDLAPDISIDPGLPAGDLSDGLEALVGTPVSKRYESLHIILDGFRELTDETPRRDYVANIIDNRSSYDLPTSWQEEHLYSYLIREMSHPEPNVKTWVEDISFVLDQLAHIDDLVPGFGENIDKDLVGIMGMSFGGAAAGEFCKTDQRCKAGANLDGFQFGENWKTPLLSPFLYVYSDALRGNSDWAYLESADKIKIYSLDESNHVDLTELVYSLPILKSIGVSGKIPSSTAINILNGLHLAFFNQFLKRGQDMEGIEFSYPGLSKRSLHQ